MRAAISASSPLVSSSSRAVWPPSVVRDISHPVVQRHTSVIDVRRDTPLKPSDPTCTQPRDKLKAVLPDHHHRSHPAPVPTPNMAPTPTLPLLSHLLPRQNAPAATVTVYADPPATTIVTTDSGSDSDSGGGGLDTGAIVGIVIGTIVGLLLIWWIVRSLSGNNKTAAPAPDTDRQGWYDDRAGAVHGRTSSRHSHRRSRSGDHHRSHRHHSRHRSSTPRPVVVVDDKQLYGEPRRPSGAYVVPMGEVRRSRSQRRSRSPGYYARY